MSRCHFEADNRPRIWIQAPELRSGAFSALVDTGYDGTVLLPLDWNPSSGLQQQGEINSVVGGSRPVIIASTTIFFDGTSIHLPCVFASDVDHAVVGILFLEAIQRTLVLYKLSDQRPVAVLVQTHPFLQQLQRLGEI